MPVNRYMVLNYLSGNLGLVLAPVPGGTLFQNHLNLAFIISGFTTIASTILIFFFVKDISVSKGQGNFTKKKRKSAPVDFLKALPFYCFLPYGKPKGRDFQNFIKLSLLCYLTLW